jgi:hypothetical protein
METRATNALPLDLPSSGEVTPYASDFDTETGLGLTKLLILFISFLPWLLMTMSTTPAHKASARPPFATHATPHAGYTPNATPYSTATPGRSYPLAPRPTPASETRATVLPKELRPPILNPYEAFTANEFDQWIGGITSALRKALGREDETDAAQEREDGGIDRTEGEDEDEDILEDSFADWKARKAAKGKGRALSEESDASDGTGREDQPIEIGSDEEHDEEVEDEDEEYVDDDGVAHVRRPEDSEEIDESEGKRDEGEGEETAEADRAADDDIAQFLSDDEADSGVVEEEDEGDYAEEGAQADVEYIVEGESGEDDAQRDGEDEEEISGDVNAIEVVEVNMDDDDQLNDDGGET